MAQFKASSDTVSCCSRSKLSPFVIIALLSLCCQRVHGFLPKPPCMRVAWSLSASSRRTSRPGRTKNAKGGRTGSFPRKGSKMGPRKPSGPRPVLTNYEENRNERTNQLRMRESIGCEHFGECSGCVVDKHVVSVDVVKSAKLFFSSTSVRRKRRDVVEGGREWAVEGEDDGFYKVVVPSRINGWRTQAKLAVAPKSSGWSKDGCSFGLFLRRSHKVLSIPNCEVHHPSINRAAEALAQATARTGTAAFQADSNEGGLRYVQFQVERSTGKICLTLVWHAEQLKQTQPALSRLVKELAKTEPDLWHSIWCHCNNGIGNNIFSRNPQRWHLLSGPEFLREPLPIGEQGWLYFTPLAFRQGNMDGFDILARDVAQAVPGGSKVCELYAGVGVLGLSTLAYHALETGKPLTWLRCSDENPANPRCFHRAVDSLPYSISGKQPGYSPKPKQREGEMTLSELAGMVESGAPLPVDDTPVNKASYLVASAGEALMSGQALGASVLIVDPPRKGLEDDVIDELCKPYDADQPPAESATVLNMSDEDVNWANDVQTLVYVSCGFDALARDCEKLLSSRAGWMLESATGYILFPGSDHVETLCIFRRD